MENVENRDFNQVQPNVQPTVEHQEPKTKRGKKKLFLLLLLLVMTAVMLTTSTYAWFTSNRTVTVEDINVNVAVSTGIQISVDGINWKTIITNADLANAHSTYSAATNQIPSTLRPVSTTAATLNSNGYLSMWLGTVSSSENASTLGQYILSTQDVSTVVDNSVSNPAANQGTNGAFVMFDLFVRLDDTSNTSNQMLYLTNGSNVIATAQSTDLGTQYSSRVAFIKENHIANGSATADIQALKTTDANNVYIWEPNYNSHNSTGLANALSYYNSANSGAQYDKATSQSFTGPIPYQGVQAAVAVNDNVLLSKANETDYATAFPSATTNAFDEVTSDIYTASNWNTGTDFEELFELTQNYITKIRVYFWIEGQDIDCENNASGGLITLKLQFSLNDGTE